VTPPIRDVWFDATHHEVPTAGRIVSPATVILVGVPDTRERSVLGLMPEGGRARGLRAGASVAALIRRGLGRVQLVTSYQGPS
jgi:hypothetical protein